MKRNVPLWGFFFTVIETADIPFGNDRNFFGVSIKHLVFFCYGQYLVNLPAFNPSPKHWYQNQSWFLGVGMKSNTKGNFM